MTPEEQRAFEALVVARAGLPQGTKILPAGLTANEHLVRTATSDTWLGPLGTVLEEPELRPGGVRRSARRCAGRGGSGPG